MSVKAGTIFDVKRYAINDGPGIRTTIFFKGCPLRCWWCHNPESQSRTVDLLCRANYCIQCEACVQACPQAAIRSNGDRIITDRGSCTRCAECVQACYTGARQVSGRQVSVEQILKQIERDIPFYDQSGGGVTFSGGEPLLQRDFLLSLLRACQAHDIHTVVDTSGYASWDTLELIRPHVNLFLYDLKLMDDERHRKHTQVSNQPILHNLKALSERGQRLIVRIPIIPGINDDLENVHQSGAFLAALPHLEQVELMGYHKIGIDKYASLGRTPRLLEMQPPASEKMDQLAEALRAFGLAVRVA